MALGDLTHFGPMHAVEILPSTTDPTSAPSATTDGIDVMELRSRGLPESVSVCLLSTAGSGAMDATVRLWGLTLCSNTWIAVGNGTGAAKGILNDGAAIDEDGSDQIAHIEPMDLPLHFKRLALQCTAINGTATAVTGWLLWSEDRG